MSELLGRYQLVDKIATGGMADVYLALQWGDGDFVREVVIKRLHRHLVERPHVLEDFCNEAKLLASLDHPALPAIYDYRQTPEGSWYIAMEYLRGPTLAALANELVQEQSGVPLQVALTIATSMCEVLQYIHAREDEESGEALEIVHGDLTPDNVILGRDGRVRLLDFGISGDFAHRQRQRDREKSIRGTLGYIAPEAISGKGQLDRRADVFVLGVLLYELTTGNRLFPGDGLAYMNAVLERSPVAPRDLIGDYPPELERILMDALQREAVNRPASCEELGKRLHQFAMGSGLSLDGATLVHHVESYFPSRNDRRAEVGPRPEGLQNIALAPTGRPPADGSAPSPSSEEIYTAPPSSDSLELSPEERDEVLQDLLDLAPDDFGAGYDPSPVSLEPEPLPDDALESLEPPAPPPPPPPPRAPSQTQTRAKVSGEEAGDDEQKADKAGFYIYVADDD